MFLLDGCGSNSKSNPCRNGQCVPIGKSDFRCICSKGWTGENCDEGKGWYAMSSLEFVDALIK